LIVAVAALVAIAFVTLSPQPPIPDASRFCLMCGSLGGVNAVLNVLLFAPLGLGLALARYPGKRALVAMCALSAFIEIAQLLVIPGRYSSIGDVMTNTAGGAIGFAVGRYAWSLIRPSPRVALALTAGWAALWLGVQAISAFGFAPDIAPAAYYGQIAPDLGNFKPFRGKVLHASIGAVAVPNGRFPDSGEVRDILSHKATVETTILPGAPSGELAPIVRVVDDHESEILLLAQNAANVLFGIRTGAAVLRLHPPLFALSNVFPAATARDSQPADTLRLTAIYARKEVSITARARQSARAGLPVVASLGWTLLLPFQWEIEGTPTEGALSAVWTACLVLPIGYWGRRRARFLGSRRMVSAGLFTLSVGAVLLYAGLVMVPNLFGIAVAPPHDWLAAVTGIFLGGVLARST
jgi:hypothetical protein